MSFARAERRRLERMRMKSATSARVIDLAGKAYRVQPLHQKQGHVDRCYANVLGNCDGVLSAEHYFSKGILKQIGKFDPSGIKWLAHLKEPMAAEKLFANCLCEYHNRMLSPLDDLATNFFASLPEFFQPKGPTIMVWGPSLERWFLKMLLGLVGTKQLAVAGEKIDSSSMDRKWVRVLYGLDEFPAECGLFTLYKAGDKIDPGNVLQATTLTLGDRLEGVQANFGGLKFWLTLAPKEKAFRTDSPDYKYIIRHLNGVDRNDAPNKLIIPWQ